MTDYKNGKVYSIRCDKTNKIYIGSTIQTLAQRKSTHHTNYNRWKQSGKGGFIRAYQLFEDYGFENCYIELIENYPCKDKAELNAREGYHQRLNKDILVNKKIEGRTDAEYRKDNVEIIREKNIKYKKDNAEKIASYREATAEKRKIQQSTKFKCEYCDCLTNSSHYSRHKRTLYCQEFQQKPNQTTLEVNSTEK
jgi:hypothetical protein